MRLVLASTSPFRSALLRQFGISFEVCAPSFVEDAVGSLAPIDLAKSFAAGKARSAGAIMAQSPTRTDVSPTIVIGADQVLELEGAILRKPDPGDLGAMVNQLMSLAGRTHALHSAVAVVLCEAGRVVREAEAVETVELTMRKFTREQAERYIVSDKPAGAVGSYLYEKRGRLLFDSVKGSDDSAIVGLPLVALFRLLRECGHDPL